MRLTPLLAIARQTVRRSIRSKLASSLLALAIGVVVFLPMILRDDGTAEGRYRVLLEYTLNVSFALVICAALWSACASVSTDALSRRLHLIVVKPVGSTTLWMGQWLGLTALHGFILAMVWVISLGQVYWRMPAGAPDERGTHPTRGIAIGETARVLVASPIPRSPHTQNGTPALYHQLRPGRTETFRFRLPRNITPERKGLLEFRFRSSRIRTPGQPLEVPLSLDIGGPTRETRQRIDGRFTEETPYRIESIDLRDAQDGWLYVAIRNQALDPPITLVIHQNEGLRLRVSQSGPLRNHIRGALILLARLAFFVALGLTAGTLFSFPVAAFTGGFWILFAALAGYIQSVLARGLLVVPHEGPPPEPTIPENMLLTLFWVFDLVLWPLRHPATVARLGANELITFREVVISVGALGLIYVGLPAVIGILALRRRELGNVS